MAKHSATKARPPQQPSQAQRQESESGTDHDHDHDDTIDHDHDQEDNENDNDNDNDNDQEDNDTQQQQADGSAPIKRKRLTQACDPCRKKKIKCDGLKPSCANCAKLELQCTYLPSLKKRGPRQGYIELLEKRLDKMEKMLQHGPGAIDPDMLDPPSGHRPGADATNNDGINSDKRTGDHRYFGNTSALSQYHELKTTPPASLTGTTAGAQIRSKRPIYGIRDEIPRKDILDHLVTLFFDSVYYQFPIIHPDTFMKQYREGKVSPNLLNAICAGVARFSNHPDVVTTPAFLAGEPFATNVRSAVIDSIDIPTVSNVQALLFLSMYEYGAARGPRAWMYGGMAIRMALELGLNREDSSPVFYLKGDWVMRETRRRAFWACFIMDVLASSSSGRPRMMDERDCEVLLPSEDNAWHEARPVVTEMLQEDEEPTSATSEGSSCKSAAMDLGKDDLPGEDLSGNERRDSTTNGDSSHKVSSLSSFAYLIRILAVLGKVSQYVNRPRAKRSIPPNEPGSEFSVINAALDAWLSSVPSHHTYSVENANRVRDKGEGCMIVFMHVIYHTSVVLLHRPILAAEKASFPIDSNFVETSVARCAEAASKVSEVLDFVSNQSCPPRVFISSFFAYPVFTTATIHITNAFASDPVIAARARRNLSTHVKILQTMKSYWAMADKFFYIIRDLYSIQSKISSSAVNGTIVVPQVVSHNAHGLHDYASDSAVAALKAKEKIMDVDRQGRIGVDRTEAEAAQGGVMEGHTSAPKMVVNSKLASISSFLKSDSGLIALWRRATEMQVIDEANQEKRRLSETTENSRKVQHISIQDEKEQGMEEKELMEQRIRMNQLEIQEINQEFERQWKAKLLAEEQQKQQQQQQSTASSDSTSVSVESQADGQDQTQSGEVSPTEKRPTEANELANPRAVKQARVSKPETTLTSLRASQRKPRSNSNSSSNSNTTNTTSPITTTSLITTPWPSMDHNQAQSGPQPGSHALSTADGNLMYRQPIAQPPQSIPSQGNFMMAQQQQQPVISAPNASLMTAAGRPADVNQHLLNVYAQQHQQQEAVSQSIDMRQNATIQRQQQQLQQQQAQAQMTSSLSLGPPGGFTSEYAPTPTMAPQQPSPMTQFRQHQQLHQRYQHQQQPQPQHQTSAAGFSSPGYYPPLVYGSSYSHQTAAYLQKEPVDSIFDFAMPLGDLNFLSSSFQMAPMMMQQTPATPATSGSNAFIQQTTTINNLPPGSLASQSRIQQQPQQQQQTMSVSSTSTTTTSNGSPSLQVPRLDANNESNGQGGRPPADSKSPQTTTQISPGLDSFMMSDEAFAEMQSTPDSLVRYLQHHHQQQQQQDLQLQPKDNRQPLLTQQNSLLYDDYFQWNQPPTVAPSLQQPHQQHAQQVQQVQQPMSMDMDTPGISGRVVAHSSIPSFS
ncbi:hypothetical protein KI688_002156 [Linnemannia hyalina]|uniref:Zn(2)-C6 fungal-type domain-containing protein n=1 Tax=Linnemannia hyalina TaxID=64524 RepID=A0A9P8BRC8_9FUNG|nr:hypothetical protein KI688_002156 [Linnemannia hyalina]